MCALCAPLSAKTFFVFVFSQTDSQITLIACVVPTRRAVTRGDTFVLRIHFEIQTRQTLPLACCLRLCLCHSRRSLFLCLSLSSALHCLIGATKGKHACELQEARRIHIQLSADQNNRGWHCTHAVILTQSIIFASLSPETFATQPWLLPHLPPSVASPWRSWGLCFLM